MNSLDTYPTYEDFESALARELGLTMSFERLRQVTMTSGRRSVAAAQNTTPVPAPVVPLDFASRYSACRTVAERRAFVRANKAEARTYLRQSGTASALDRSTPTPTTAKSRCVRRSLK